MTRVACQQLAPAIGDLEANRALCLAAIAEAVDAGAEVIVLPELVATKWWHQLLHNQSALRLKALLLFRPGTVVVNVPYHLQKHKHIRRRHRRSEDPDAI